MCLMIHICFIYYSMLLYNAYTSFWGAMSLSRRERKREREREREREKERESEKERKREK